MVTVAKRVGSAAAVVVVLAACAGGQEAAGTQARASEDPMNTLSEAEREAGWTLLFDGLSLDGWRGYNMDGLPGGWAVEDGLLTRTGPGGDLITREQFDDFELTVDWMVEEGGNSGIFYRAAEGEERIYHSAPEFQVLDDPHHADGADPVTSAGSNYGLNPAPRGVVRPANEWNTARIVVRGVRVEHWLNGSKVVEYELHGAEWDELVANSKFVEWPAYGQAPRGHIGLQDHGDRVWYRNMKVRVIG